MKSESQYLAAKIVSETIESHFSQHIHAAFERGEIELAPKPSSRNIESIIDAAFWASLRREEGHLPKISMAFLPPSQAGHPLLFEQQIPLTPYILTKLSPGVERPGVHLGVWHQDDNLFIWGTTLRIPNYCFVLDVSEPGLLVIKHRRAHGFGKFANVAVLTGDQAKVVDESYATVEESPDLLKFLLGSSSDTSSNNSMNVLVQLAVSMRAHRHGGTLLIVPTGTEGWRKSIIHPIKYSVMPRYAGIGDLIKQETDGSGQVLWQGILRTELDSIAGLTAVDGATILNDKFELLGFGSKILRYPGNPRVERVLLKEPVSGNQPSIIDPAQSGGTRHLSAAQFVHDQKDVIALVASQDGYFTVFTWSDRMDMVLAHRIDTLLL